MAQYILSGTFHKILAHSGFSTGDQLGEVYLNILPFSNEIGPIIWNFDSNLDRKAILQKIFRNINRIKIKFTNPVKEFTKKFL